MLARSSLAKGFAITAIVIALLAVSVMGLFIFLGKDKASASPVTNFLPGRIIDDSVFYNKDAMNPQQIQAFLDRLIPNCDVWGTGQSEYGGGTRAQYAASQGWPGPPYVCINKYYENPTTGDTSFEKGGGAFDGGISAAQIIYNAAQQYGINPQVLLVMLKKESAGPLTSDSWPLKSQYKYAMGYACPDSGPNYSASCDSTKAGLYKQVNLAAWQLNYYKQHPNDYRYSIGWNDIQYSPDPTCGTKHVYIENMATLSLYIYTPYTPNDASLAAYPGQASCGSYGNRNFFMFFSEWFGSPSTPAPTVCDSKVAGIACVWSLRKADGSQFLTTSTAELSAGMYSYGWINEGIEFYASNTQQPNTVPVYRIQKSGKHYFTADQSEYNSMVSTGGWSDEGIAFYEPASTASNTSHIIYRLQNPSNGNYYWTTDGSQRDLLKSTGYTQEVSPFNSFSGIASLPSTDAGRNNIYRLQNGPNFFYTINVNELEAVIKSGYSYNGVITTTSTANTGTPVYRLRYSGNKYFFTASATERDSAVQSYGMIDEGIGFYVDSGSAPIYRLSNSKYNTYFYASDVNEIMSTVNTDGWVYENTLVNSTNSISPVYRFLNLMNNRHFYTIDFSEAAQIANKGWKYETVAFSASPTTGTPVYRLLLYDKHFYTTNANERDLAVSKYGYKYEKIAFYVNDTATGTPVYRLQGGNNEYFYTASSQERDSAVSKYGYSYEGVGFYLPTS